MPSSPSRYPQPKPIGGKLIRQVVAAVRAEESLKKDKLTSHILIAISGGADSTALAHLIVKYGRRVGAPGQLSLLHVNHGWRGAESDADEQFVRGLGKAWGVAVIVRKLDGPPQTGSWEEAARSARKSIFDEEARARRAIVLTAHHADDVAETMLWRLLTGAAKTHGGGIAERTEHELRPLLKARRAELLEYLREEQLSYCNDSSNADERFMRARMRGRLIPELEGLFPKAVDHLVELALEAQQAAAVNTPSGDTARLLFAAAGLRARRAHLEGVESLRKDGSIDLPEGWVLRREAGGARYTLSRQPGERGARFAADRPTAAKPSQKPGISSLKRSQRMP